MSDIFLSYASEDVARASQLAHALSLHGWSVWWDRSILPGTIFDTVIEAELSAAKCVIVLWTFNSVKSRWVRAEAGEALEKGRLIPVLLDDAVIPLVFRQVQAASLIGWDGDDAHAGFQHLLKALSSVAPLQPTLTVSQPESVAAHTAAPLDNARPPIDSGTSRGGSTSDRRTGWWALVAVGVLAIAGGAFYFLRDDPPTGLSPDANLQQIDPAPDSIANAPAPQIEPSRQDDARAGQADAKPKSKPTRTTPGPQSEAADSAKPRAITPAPAPPESESPKHESPIVKQPAPVAVKPTAEGSAAQLPQTIAKTEPAPTPTPTPPLTILTVAWGMPNDNGLASSARVKEYSAHLSRMMTSVIDEVMGRPVRFDYHYPDQREYYRLLKDKDGYTSSKALCSANRADLVIAGFVKGAEFVSANFGYALIRDPVFSVFDCRTNKKTAQTYHVASHIGDRFPFEKAMTTVFRTFAQQDATLSDY